MNETRNTKKQTPILSINNIIMSIYPTVSWRAADCSQNNRVPVDRYVTPIYVYLLVLYFRDAVLYFRPVRCSALPPECTKNNVKC